MRPPVGMWGFGSTGVGLYRGKFEFGRNGRPGHSVPGVLFVSSMRLPVVAKLFFISVNQVLVRLWTRVTNVVPAFGDLPHLRMGGQRTQARVRSRRSVVCLTGNGCSQEQRPSGRRRGFRGV